MLPGRKRTSTIRLPNRDQGPLLQRLQEYETKTDKRLKDLEQNNVLVKQLLSTVSALNEEHQSFDCHQSDTTAQLQGQREHFQGLLQHLVRVVERVEAEGRAGSQELHAHVEVSLPLSTSPPPSFLPSSLACSCAYIFDVTTIMYVTI